MKDRGIVVGALALAGAALLFGAALTRAMVGAPTAPSEPAEASAPGVADTERADVRGGDAFPGASDMVPGEVIRLAAERAPFEPDRRAPSERYQLPGERVVERPREEVREPPPFPPFRVLGTVGGPDGGVAVIEAEGQSPRVFATGQELLGYTVKSVQGDAVVVSSQGWDVSLSVEAAQSEVGSSRGRDDDRGRDRDDERAQERQERALEQARERLQTVAEQMQRQGGGPVRMEIQGDRAIIVGPNGVRREIQLPGGGNDGNVTFRAAPTVRVRPGGGR